MSYIQIAPYCVAVLEIAACIVYLWHAEWRLALVWAGVGIANFAFAGIR